MINGSEQKSIPWHFPIYFPKTLSNTLPYAITTMRFFACAIVALSFISSMLFASALPHEDTSILPRATTTCTPGHKYCIDGEKIATCSPDHQLVNPETCQYYCARRIIDGEEQGFCAILIDGPDPGYKPPSRPTATPTGLIPSAPPGVKRI